MRRGNEHLASHYFSCLLNGPVGSNALAICGFQHITQITSNIYSGFGISATQCVDLVTRISFIVNGCITLIWEVQHDGPKKKLHPASYTPKHWCNVNTSTPHTYDRLSMPADRLLNNTESSNTCMPSARSHVITSACLQLISFQVMFRKFVPDITCHFRRRGTDEIYSSSSSFSYYNARAKWTNYTSCCLQKKLRGMTSSKLLSKRSN